MPRALLALLEPFFFCPGDFPRLLAPSEEPVDGVALAAELVAVVVEGDTWRDSDSQKIHCLQVFISGVWVIYLQHAEQAILSQG